MSVGALIFGGWNLAVVAAKWALYTSSFAGAGGAMFTAIFAATIPPMRRRAVDRWVQAMCAAGIIIGAGRICVLVGSLNGDPMAMLDPRLLGLMLRSGEGTALMLRSIGLIATMASPACAGRSGKLLSVVGVVLVAISYTQVGRVLGSTSILAAQLALAIHVSSLCYWLGALVPLRLCCQDVRGTEVAPLLGNFGNVAIYVVGALLVAGICLLALLLNGATDALDSLYVGTFISKVGLVSVLIALATRNKLELVPRLDRGEAKALVVLRRSIVAEIAVALGILLVTAVLTTVVQLRE